MRNFRVTDPHCKHVLNYFFVACSKITFHSQCMIMIQKRFHYLFPAYLDWRNLALCKHLGIKCFSAFPSRTRCFFFSKVKEFKFMFGLRLVNIKYITAWFSEVFVIVLNETYFNWTPKKPKKNRWARKRNWIFSPCDKDCILYLLTARSSLFFISPLPLFFFLIPFLL